MSKEPTPELDGLRKAIDGLDYPSESDTPFDAFRWEGKPGGAAMDLVRAKAAGRKVEEVAVAAFFEPLADSEDAERFAELRRVLEAQVTGLKVFRTEGGEAEVDIYLLGQAHSGAWVGVHTVSVET